MSGKYLKARQLAKEMEKIAKKTAEEKKEAQDSLVKAEELLDQSKELGAEVGDAESLIDEARELFEEKELEKCIKKVDKGLDILREANSKRINELIEGTEELHELIGEEERYEGSLKRLEDAKKSIEDDDFKEALETAKGSLELAQLEIQEKLTDEFATLDSMVISIEDKEDDVEIVETKVEEAREAMEDYDFPTAVSLVNECKEILFKDLKKIADEKITKVKKQQDLVRKSGGDTTTVEEFVSKAQTRMEEGHFESAMQFIEDAKTEMNDAMKDIVEKREGELDGSIEEAKELECDTSKIDEFKEDIKELKRQGKYSEAFNVLEEVLQKTDELKFQKVLKTIAESREYFIKGKEIGIDTSEPMGLLNKARNSLKQGDHRGALEWAQSGRQKVRDLVEEHEGLEMRIAEAERVREGLMEIGIELPEAEGIISAAEGALKDKDYQKTEEKLEEFDGYIDKQAYQDVMELVENLEHDIMTAEKMDLDTGSFQEQLEVAIANTKSAEYAKAGKMALDATEELESVIQEDMTDRIENIKGLIEKVKEELSGDEDLDELGDVEDIVSDVESAFSEGRYDDAYGSLLNASKEIKKWRVGEAEERYTKLKNLVELLESLELEDIDVKAYQEEVIEVTEAFENDDFSKVVKVSEQAIKKLNDELKNIAEDVFSRAKMEAVKAKKAGVDIEELRHRLIDCKKHIRDEEYHDAIKQSLKVEEDAKHMTVKRKSSYELISSLSTKLTSLKKSGELDDITPVKDLLLKAKNSFQDKDYTQAENLAIQAKEKIEELKSKSDFEGKLRNLRENLEKASSLGIDVSDTEGSIENITSVMKEGDIETALEEINRTQDDLETMMSSYVKPEIERTWDIIESAKEIGVDVSSPESILKDGEKRWEDGEYLKALNSVESCQREIESIKNKSKRAAGGVKRVKERIEEAKDLQADVSEAKKLLKEAIKALREDKYEKAIEFTEKAEEEAEEAELVRVYDILKVFNKKIAEVRKEGVNTAFAENLMKRAEKAMDAGKYREAINLAMQSEGEVERIELQKDIAKRSISTTSKKLEKASAGGIKLGDAGKLLEQAKQAFKGGFYVKAFDNAVKSGDELNRLINAHEQVTEKLEGIQTTLESMDGLDVGEEGIRKKVDEIERSVGRGRYGKALESFKKVDESMDEVMEKLPQVMDEIENTLDDFEESGKNIGDARKYLKDARASMGVGEVKDICQLIQEAKKEFGGDLVEEYNRYIEEAQGLIQTAKKFGAAVEEADRLVAVAESSQDDAELARDKAKKALESIEKALEPYSPSIEMEIEGVLQKGTWNDIEITLKNPGRGVAKNPDVIVKGAERKHFDLPAMLKAGEELTVDIELKPLKEDVLLIAEGTRIFDGKKLMYESDVQVVEKAYEMDDSTGDEKCSVCGGSIKEGLEIIRCSCGDTIHKPCGEKEGTCPNCGIKFKFKKEKKASKRVALKI